MMLRLRTYCLMPAICTAYACEYRTSARLTIGGGRLFYLRNFPLVDIPAGGNRILECNYACEAYGVDVLLTGALYSDTDQCAMSAVKRAFSILIGVRNYGII